MKKFIVPSVLASLLFILPTRANENNGNNDYCVSPKSTGNCLNTVPRQAYPTPHLPGPQPVMLETVMGMVGTTVTLERFT